MLTATHGHGFMASSGTVQEFDITVSDQQLDFVVSTKIAAMGWDGVSPAHVRITITETGALGSSSTATASLVFDDLPPGSDVKVFNRGYVCGRGGPGGIGGSGPDAPTAGGNGGPAISVSATTNASCEIQNFSTGRIGGGGGGGGGGGRQSESSSPSQWGSCGGGGSGIPEGDGGTPHWMPRRLWGFASSVEGWTAIQATLGAAGGVLTMTATNIDPQLISPSVSLVGSEHRFVKVRARPISASPTFEGIVYYATSGHGYSASYRKSISASISQNAWQVFTWDMSALTAGGSDWTDSTITRIRIDLTNSQQDWEVSHVALGNDPSEIDAFFERESYESSWMFRGNPGKFPYGGCHGAADSAGRRGGRGGHVGQAGGAGQTAALDAGAAGGSAGTAIVDPANKLNLVNAGTVWDSGNVPSISTWASSPMSCFADAATYTPPGAVDAISGIHEDMYVECATRNGSRFFKQVKNLVPGDLLWTLSPTTRYANRFFAKDAAGTLPGSEEYDLYGHELNISDASNSKAFGLCEVFSTPVLAPLGSQRALRVDFSNGTTVKLLSCKMLVPNVYPSNPSIYDAIWKRTEDFPDYRTRYYGRVVPTFPVDPISAPSSSISSTTLEVPERGKYRKVLLRRLTVASTLGNRAGDTITVGGSNSPPGNAICWVH